MHYARHLLALSAVSAAALISTPVVAQYQSTTPIFQFRMDQSTPFKRLYFFGTSGERLDRSEYYLVIKKEERLNSTDQLQVSIPRGFYKRFKLGALNVCTMQRGGFVKKTKCKDSIAFNSIFDDSNHLIAGLSISAPAGRVQDEWVTSLKETSERISKALGWHPNF